MDIDRWSGTSRPNLETLPLGRVDVDSADGWTSRSLSSRSRSRADESGPNYAFFEVGSKIRVPRGAARRVEFEEHRLREEDAPRLAAEPDEVLLGELHLRARRRVLHGRELVDAGVEPPQVSQLFRRLAPQGSAERHRVSIRAAGAFLVVCVRGWGGGALPAHGSPPGARRRGPLCACSSSLWIFFAEASPIPRVHAPSRRRKSLPNRDATKGGAPSCAERVVASLVDIISHLAGRTAAAAARASAVARWRRARRHSRDPPSAHLPQVRQLAHCRATFARASFR